MSEHNRPYIPTYKKDPPLFSRRENLFTFYTCAKEQIEPSEYGSRNYEKPKEASPEGLEVTVPCHDPKYPRENKGCEECHSRHTQTIKNYFARLSHRSLLFESLCRYFIEYARNCNPMTLLCKRHQQCRIFLHRQRS